MLYSLGGLLFYHTQIRIPKKKEKKKVHTQGLGSVHVHVQYVVTVVFIRLSAYPCGTLPFPRYPLTSSIIPFSAYHSCRCQLDSLLDQYYDARRWRKKRLDFRLGNDAEMGGEGLGKVL